MTSSAQAGLVAGPSIMVSAHRRPENRSHSTLPLNNARPWRDTARSGDIYDAAGSEIPAAQIAPSRCLS